MLYIIEYYDTISFIQIIGNFLPVLILNLLEPKVINLDHLALVRPAYTSVQSDQALYYIVYTIYS